MPENARKRWFKSFLENSSFIRHYLWQYKKWVGIGLFALVVVDVLEVLPPIFLKNAVDVIVERQPLRVLGYLAVGYFVTAWVQSLCRYGWRMFLIRASVFAGRDLREKFADHLFGLSPSFFDRTRMGTLMSLATNDIESVRIAVGSGVLVLGDALFYLLTVPVVMYYLSPQLTWLVCLPLPFIPFIVLRSEKRVHERFEKVQECFGRISALTQESLNGIRVIKGFGKEDTQTQKMKEIGEEYMRLNLSLSKIQSTVGPTMDFTMSIGMVILILFGGGPMTAQGAASSAITLGTYVAFQRYIQKMVWPMAALGMAINYYQRSVTSSYRLKRIFATRTDVPQASLPILPPRKVGKVEFRKLSFSFPGSSKKILSEIDLTIESGERVAIVGSIGCGKSAILSLLPRLYPISHGMLWIDDVDVNDWPLDELRRQVGYVSQEVFLFSETIMENVAFGLHEWVEHGNELEPVEQAARLASVHEEIIGFESAYRTRLGERGINLSGGQKQRLTIARALAMQPSILVLDDALSSVDVRTEEKILQGLRSRPGRNTEIIAAHRISTVQDADRIIVIEDGKILQVGTHSRLMAQMSGTYRKFYEQQQIREELENYGRVLRN